VGLFSIFKKADTVAPLTDDEAARLAANSEAERLSQQARQREIARATAMKIDAIESAMAADIFSNSEPAWGSQRPPRPARAPDATRPLDDIPTTLLLADDIAPQPAVAAESAPVVEEIAILYANGQDIAAQQLLEAAVADSAGNKNGDRSPWWMLFDLYQASGQQENFDDLSIDYASTFETSPPSWTPPTALGAMAPGWAGVAPTEAFVGMLNQQIAPQLARLLQLAATSPVLRLEFGRVIAVEESGCALLRAALRELQARQRELVLVDAAGLAALIKSGLAVGRRDDGEAPWLLLLELLQLLNREKEFEQVSMDYCVTYEVSPPPWTPPPKVATPAAQHAPASPDRFMLPPRIDGQLGPLQQAIQHYAAAYPSLVFDCSRLVRIDYACAMQLHSTLQALAAEERKIAFRDVNHLVAALLRLQGYASLARIYPHKY